MRPDPPNRPALDIPRATEDMMVTTLLLIWACAPVPEDSISPISPDVSDAPETMTSGWKQALTGLDAQLAKTRERAEASPTDWLILAQAAELHRQRARLSGDWDDYAAADELLAQAFTSAPDGAGPWMGKAALDFTLHRTDQVEESLARAEGKLILGDDERAAILVTRANLARQLGDADLALALATEAHELHPSMGSDLSLAQTAWKTGDFEGAEVLIDRAEGRYHAAKPEPLAWLDLQRGLLDLDRGRLDDALAHYEAAADHLDGYWLIEEHIAEIDVLQGRPDDARPRYVVAIAASGDPELMAALGELELAVGDEAQGQRLLDEAGAVHRARLERYPEAASGHALDHVLTHGEPTEALALARAEATRHPNGDALSNLAAAHLRTGDTDAAASAIEDALATGWRSADIFTTAAEVYTAAGDTEAASEAWKAARIIDPSAGPE